MSEEAARRAQRAAQEEREGALVFARSKELVLRPIQGRFDVEHLKAIHHYLFQDLPELHPGVMRGETPSWSKHRALEGGRSGYDVHYAHQNIEGRIADILDAFGGPDTLRSLSTGAAANRLAGLYADLDHAHGFYEGNSRTLRVFSRELANAAGFSLDWGPTNTSAHERNALYIARDVAVLERAFPGLTPERGMETDNPAEYEASLALPALQLAMGARSLETIVREGLTPSPAIEHAGDQLTRFRVDLSRAERDGGAMDVAEARARLDKASEYFSKGEQPLLHIHSILQAGRKAAIQWAIEQDPDRHRADKHRNIEGDERNQAGDAAQQIGPNVDIAAPENERGDDAVEEKQTRDLNIGR